MVRHLALILVALFIVSAHAQSRLRSAARRPGSSYLAYKLSASLFAAPRDGKTPSEVAVKYTPSAVRAVSEWKSVVVMNERFRKFRDIRFLTSPAQPSFLRRPSWLYPDDGCFARAALAVLNLMKVHVSPPDKIFVFGNLTVKTSNSPGGSVSWWYHVAPIVQVAGEKYVLDPALNPGAPMKVEDWLGLMGQDLPDLEVAICKSGSYAPDDPCDHESDGVEAQALDDQANYLDLEWSRLGELGREPVRELGDAPPWLVPVAGI